jgi:hypothetical protein
MRRGKGWWRYYSRRDDNANQGNLFGTDPHILHRREGPITSVMAAYSVDTGYREHQALSIIATFGEHGGISDDVRDCCPKGTPYPSITARYSALEDKGMIRRDKSDQREGHSGDMQMVMRITEHGLYVLTLPPPEPKKKGTRKPRRDQ